MERGSDINEIFLTLIFSINFFPSFEGDKIFRRGWRINNSDDRDSCLLEYSLRAGRDCNVIKKLRTRFLFLFFFTKRNAAYCKKALKAEKSFTRKLAVAVLWHRIETPSRKAGHISFGKPNSHRHPFRILPSSRRRLTRPKGGTRSMRWKTCKYFNSDIFDVSTVWNNLRMKDRRNCINQVPFHYPRLNIASK